MVILFNHPEQRKRQRNASHEAVVRIVVVRLDPGQLIVGV